MIPGRILLVHLASSLRPLSRHLRRRWRCLAILREFSAFLGARQEDVFRISSLSLPPFRSYPFKFEGSLKTGSRARVVYNDNWQLRRGRRLLCMDIESARQRIDMWPKEDERLQDVRLRNSTVRPESRKSMRRDVRPRGSRQMHARWADS